MPENIEHIYQEMQKHDLGLFVAIKPDHEAINWAVSFLKNESAVEMIEALTKMSQEGRILMGPVDGFVAAALVIKENDYIILSNLYPEYLTPNEIMASVLHEIGAIRLFARSSQENELLCEKALEWYVLQTKPSQVKKVIKLKEKTPAKFLSTLQSVEGPQLQTSSIITMAAQKVERRAKEALNKEIQDQV